jgi:hypothetical protein
MRPSNLKLATSCLNHPHQHHLRWRPRTLNVEILKSAQLLEA